MPTFDERDAELLAARITNRALRAGPRVGDYIEFENGCVGRFSHDWGESIQWSKGGSFYLTHGGQGSFSGGLYPSVPKAALELIPDTERPGRFWFFHHDDARAHNGVDVEAPCRVYRFQGLPLPWGAKEKSDD